MLLIAAIVSLSGCAREPDDTTPEGALALFLDALDRSAHQDDQALRDAYALLDEGSQGRLAERARSATALGSREYEPWEMLVQGRTQLRFPPRRGAGLRARPGEALGMAVVVVTGAAEGQRAEVPMRLEEDGWRVIVAIPAVTSDHRP